MQRPHEWKADMLTLRDLGINWQRYGRISKQKTGVRIKNNIMVSTGVSRGRSTESNEPETKKPEGLTTREGLNLAGRTRPSVVDRKSTRLNSSHLGISY